MAKVLYLLYEDFYRKLEYYRDQRFDNYFLLGSPIKVILITALYLHFVFKSGPNFMKNRKPFELKYVLMAYNLFQVVACFTLGTMGALRISSHFGHLTCVELNFTESGYYDGRLSYCFYLLKLIDLLDTVFFVLRKKENQISFLHVYHHAGMAVAGYIHTQYLPGGQFAILGILNCFVHSIMYFYYFITSFKNAKKYLWWKKYITLIQIVQFISIIFFMLLPFSNPNCKLSKILLILTILQNVFMLSMFLDFYIKTYVKNKKH